MLPAARPEDYIVLGIFALIFYLLMSYLQKKLNNIFERSAALARWGYSIPLTENQHAYLLKLWMAYKKKSPPTEDLSQMLLKEELDQIKQYCRDEFVPENMKQRNSSRAQTESELKNLGFSSDQAFIIGGLIYNKIGGIHAIRPI